MPIYTAEQSKEAAKTRKRDAHGHFVKEDIKRKVSPNNPFKKFLYWLDQTRGR